MWSPPVFSVSHFNCCSLIEKLGLIFSAPSVPVCFSGNWSPTPGTRVYWPAHPALLRPKAKVSKWKNRIISATWRSPIVKDAVYSDFQSPVLCVSELITNEKSTYFTSFVFSDFQEECAVTTNRKQEYLLGSALFWDRLVCGGDSKHVEGSPKQIIFFKCSRKQRAKYTVF